MLNALLILTFVGAGLFMAKNAWSVPQNAYVYLPFLHKAEDEHGLPRGLLVRMAYQESRFRPEIIDGTVRSGANAVGLMQIVPRWHPNVNPTDPYDSIQYAAKYMAENYQRFGDWELALAAYNWGPTNVSRNRHNRSSWPKETRDYVAQISADVILKA